MTDGQKFGIGLTGLALFLLWLLNKKGLLHESVTHTIGPVTAVVPTGPTGTTGPIAPDPLTGAPQFNASNAPANEDLAVAPLDYNGVPTFTPSQPKKATCPQGFVLWRNADNGAYECIQS